LTMVCMNLPPDQRFKSRNLLAIDFVPGPNDPKDCDSFLYLFVQEFLVLGKGVKAWNGFRKRIITMKVHLCMVTADMPGRAQLQAFKGHNATSFCNYCFAKAVNKGKGSYCPFCKSVRPRTDGYV
ncbi:hypothetical protein K440DRAFT_561606, partial [Wilcoxina mikolae CBS 423.85]